MSPRRQVDKGELRLVLTNAAGDVIATWNEVDHEDVLWRLARGLDAGAVRDQIDAAIRKVDFGEPDPASARPEREAVVKTCACGAAYTEAGWRALAYRWVQGGIGDVPDHECRDCVCGSTISRPLPLPEVTR